MAFRIKKDYCYSGVYAIVNTTKQKTYIGSSQDIERRFRQHISALKSGHHPCAQMQADYSKGHRFSLKVLYCEVVKPNFAENRRAIYKIEKTYIDQTENLYNINGIYVVNDTGEEI